MTTPCTKLDYYHIDSGHIEDNDDMMIKIMMMNLMIHGDGPLWNDSADDADAPLWSWEKKRFPIIKSVSLLTSSGGGPVLVLGSFLLLASQTHLHFSSF